MPENISQQPTRARKWKRTAAAALLLLAGGAVVNVAVAWGCVIPESGRGVTTFILTQHVDDRFIIKYGHNAYAGWPARSMQWRSSGRPFTTTTDDFLKQTVEQERLPLRPLYPGFAVNTVFYALLLWMLFFAPFTARRMLRRRRGQCEKCAYPIGTSEVCTECGAAVRPSLRRSAGM